MSATMPGEATPNLRGFSGDRILVAALLISLAVHALALLPTFSPPSSGGNAPLRATLHNPPAASNTPAIVPPALDDAIAAPKREAVPEPTERTYGKPSPAVQSPEAASDSAPVTDSAGATTQAEGATPAAENSVLPPLPRPAIDLSALRQYHAALSRVADRFRTYPAQAREAGWEGLVAMRLSIAEGGVPVGLELIGSSGYPVLDRAALEMMHLAATHTPVPESLRGRAFTIDLGARYNLKDPS